MLCCYSKSSCTYYLVLERTTGLLSWGRQTTEERGRKHLCSGSTACRGGALVQSRVGACPLGVISLCRAAGAYNHETGDLGPHGPVAGEVLRVPSIFDTSLSPRQLLLKSGWLVHGGTVANPRWHQPWAPSRAP